MFLEVEKVTDRERLVRRLHDWGTVEAEALADYLLENGVIVPPCKVGDTVYYLEGSRILEGTVKSFSAIMKDNYFVVYVETKYSLLGIERFGYWMFGKRIFLTREEAEKALKERETE